MPNARSIVVRQLMNHTSGLVRYEFNPRVAEKLTREPDHVWTPVERLSYLFGTAAPFAPGDGWNYSDTNYIVLGMIVEQVTGRALYDEVQRRILGPHGLRGIIPSDRRDLPGVVQGYAGPGNPFGGHDEMLDAGRMIINPQMEWAGGGFATTAGDLARWARLLFGGGVVPPDVLSRMLDGVATRPGADSRYGLGVMIRTTPLGTGLGHGGFFPGWLTEVRYYPEADIAVALQFNTSVAGSIGRGTSAALDRIASIVANAQVQAGTLIVGAAVVDGTGSPRRSVDVRIAHGRIAAIGELDPLPGEQVVDARGLVLAPGFIDSHSHHDRGLLQQRDALAAVSQGITTIVVGQDGGSQVPLADFFNRLGATPVAVNVASYAGHGTIRSQVMGADFQRHATAAEIVRMEELLRAELAAGALGLSTGLEYDPGIWSAPEEVLALARVTAAAGGRYISHIRSEDRDFWEALEEILRIGHEADLPVQVSHMKLGMRKLWGQADSLVARLDRARASGIDVTADVYPWTMWQATLTVLYPQRNFTDRGETEFILREVATADDLRLGAYGAAPEYVGRTVREIAALRAEDPATTLMWLIAEARRTRQAESVVATGMDEQDVVRLLQWPHASISSDGMLAGAHPRGFGSMTRVLGRYVREQAVLSLEDAIRKMTTLPAQSLGLATDRGRIAVGAAADLVLFDPHTVRERATVEEPHATSLGIHTVWVNGIVVFADGRTTSAHPGVVLHRPRVRQPTRR